MNKCPWEEIYAFRSLLEYKNFENWMEQQIQAGKAEETEVKKHFSDATFEERWFKHCSSGIIWRLVEPDPPFRGTFEQVK